MLIFRIAIVLLLAPGWLPGSGDPEARLIDLNVVAVDGRGLPVNDLTGDDFQVTDAGKRQQIAFFRHNDSKLLQALSLGQNEFSNRGGVNSAHATLVLFDLLNERFATRGVSANQIIHELGSLETANNLYLFLLTVDGRLYPVHGFPGPEEPANQPGGAPWTRGIKPLMDEALRTVLRVRPVDIDVNVRVQLTFNALDEIAAQLARFPGRKNVVWVTDGVPIALGPRYSDTGDFVDFTPQLRQLSEGFERSGVAIYPVRQVMLGSPDAMGAADGNGSGIGSQETLDEFAGLTGGRPTGSKDVGAAVRQAISDVRSSYQIGYYPPARNWDSKFHKLRVACLRKGVRIQARTGYYAWPEAAGARAQRAIGTAISTGFDAREIGLRGSLSPDPKDKGREHLAVRIDANDVTLAKQGSEYSCELRIVVAGYLAGGRTLTSALVPLDLRYSPTERQQTLKEGIAFAQDLTLGENVRKVKIVVFDRGSNAVGSMTIPVRPQ